MHNLCHEFWISCYPTRILKRNRESTTFYNVAFRGFVERPKLANSTLQCDIPVLSRKKPIKFIILRAYALSQIGLL